MQIEKIIALCAASLFIGVAFAAFIDDRQPVSTVAEALKMRNDTPVILQGNIISHIRKDKYQFVDQTGEIIVEIDTKNWHNVDVRPTDTVKIYGEVDKDWATTEIDVDSVEIIP